jgi:hypothetical protein
MICSKDRKDDGYFQKKVLQRACRRLAILLPAIYATGWATGVRVPAATSDFSFFQGRQTGCGAHPATSLIGTGGGSSRGVKLATHQYVFMARYLFKHWEKNCFLFFQPEYYV